MGGASRQRQEDQQDVDSQPASGGLGMFKAIGESSSGQIIPGVKQGDFTFLNSDQLTYYSFYARLNEAIAYRWVSRVRNYVEMLTPAMQKQLARSPNVTVVDIMLNKKGDYLGAKILRSSGDTNLDQAAIAPFKEAAPFENPPLEMADGNGTIHIVGQFTLMFEGI
jgi:TonB family protein